MNACVAQLFLPGRRNIGRRSGRALKTAADVCTGWSRDSKIKRFCNGDPDPFCDATGFVVRKAKV